ncbi:MAG: hypothetical protein LUD72_00545 [Bacteroidales bacterium]|nr:hypothetical protein [Bacteroidales bacterium]
MNMKKTLKRSLALLLTFMIALSTLTCLAVAAEDDVTEVTIYVTYDEKEIRPGLDKYVDIKYTISPVTDLMKLRFTVSDPEELVFETLTDTSHSYAEALFGGEGEMSTSGRSIQASAYYAGSAFSCDEDYYLFAARYSVPDNTAGGEVTFGLDEASVSLLGAGTVTVNVETEPIPIVVVDTSALESEIMIAEAYLNLKDHYSEYSINNLEKALDAAQEVLNNIRNYYQDDVNQVLDALKTAVDNLRSPADEVAAAIEAAEQLRESDYTKDSWGNMTDALEAAKEIQSKGDAATDDELNGAANALYAAIDALEVLPEQDALAASREALEQAIETVKGLNEDDYSESSWAALQAALEAAEEVLNNENATKEELDDAYDALALALARANLESDVELAKQLDSSKYTADSWAVLQAALDDAEAVLDDENATQTELENADDALAAALDGLVPADTDKDGGTTTTYPGGTSSGGTTSGITSPQTGDSNIFLLFMSALAAGMGTCAVICVSKAHRKKA